MSIKHKLEQIIQCNTDLLSNGLKGIERETLRTVDAKIANTQHPKSLGSALTHPYITTDYAESLLELVTGAFSSHDQLFIQLEQLHTLVYQSTNEVMWASSMPPVLPLDKQISIAKYGSSAQGQFKETYRKALGMRYGRTMQCIAGIHFNYSFHPQLLELFNISNNEAYMHVIRNFRRIQWLIVYLFGASPMLDDSFANNTNSKHKWHQFTQDTYGLKYATSLRMSDSGYTSAAQNSINPCYNSLEEYINNISTAINTSYFAYEKIGLFNDLGERIQLSANILQIENEHYSTIRPKQPQNTNERPIHALSQRGISYIEIRCIDVNPLTKLGIDKQTTMFLEVVLLYCFLHENIDVTKKCCDINNNNFKKVVQIGRQPNLFLNDNGRELNIKSWAHELHRDISFIAQHMSTEHAQAVDTEFNKFNNTTLMPSDILFNASVEADSFAKYIQNISLQHKSTIPKYLPVEMQIKYNDIAKDSVVKQLKIEQESTDLETYIKKFFNLN